MSFCSALAGVTFAGCGPKASELCTRSVALGCDRLYECTPPALLEPMQASLGATAAECRANQEASKGCADKKADNELCDSGKTYHLDKASACSDKVKAQSCADFLDAAKKPAECSEVCT